MPYPMLLHLNMEKYGGGDQSLNQKYQRVLGDIQKGVHKAGGQIVVYGLTEVMNDRKAWNALEHLAEDLNAKVLQVAHAGQTVHKYREYIAVLTGPGFEPTRFGRCSLRDGQKVEHETESPQDSRWEKPPLGNPDYRGLVYVVGKLYGTTEIAVGFIHNTYTLKEQKVLVAQNLPHMAAVIKEKHPKVQAIYIGGDFNSKPIDLRGDRHVTLYAYYTDANTTKKHLYDYWYTTIAPEQTAFPPYLVKPVPFVDHTPRDEEVSDHSAILLQIGAKK